MDHLEVTRAVKQKGYVCKNSKISRKSDNVHPINYKVPEPRKMVPGENFNRFLKSFEHYANLVKIPAKNRIDMLISFLDPILVERVLVLDLTQEEKDNPNMGYQRIASVLDGPRDLTSIRMGLIQSLQQDLSISEYAEHIRLLVADCEYESEKMRDEKMFQTFIKGLRSNEIRKDILRQSPNIDTFEGAVAHAIKIYMADQTAKTISRQNQEAHSIPIYNLSAHGQRIKEDVLLSENSKLKSQVREKEAIIQYYKQSGERSRNIDPCLGPHCIHECPIHDDNNGSTRNELPVEPSWTNSGGCWNSGPAQVRTNE